MKFLILFITTFLFGFKVEFNNIQKIHLFPDKKAILLETTKPIKIDYSPKIYTSKGIILLNYKKADEFVRNNLYFNGSIKNINIAIFNINENRNLIIQKLNKYYKKCNIDKIIFKDNFYEKVYFTPKILKINSKIILECY